MSSPRTLVLWTHPPADVLRHHSVSKGEGIGRVGDRTLLSTRQRGILSHFVRSGLDFYTLLQRTVLYTVLTRAQQHCVIVGTRSALHRAITTHQTVPRLTGLAAAFQRALPQRRAAPVSS